MAGVTSLFESLLQIHHKAVKGYKACIVSDNMTLKQVCTCGISIEFAFSLPVLMDLEKGGPYMGCLNSFTTVLYKHS